MDPGVPFARFDVRSRAQDLVARRAAPSAAAASASLLQQPASQGRRRRFPSTQLAERLLKAWGAIAPSFPGGLPRSRLPESNGAVAASRCDDAVALFVAWSASEFSNREYASTSASTTSSGVPPGALSRARATHSRPTSSARDTVIIRAVVMAGSCQRFLMAAGAGADRASFAPTGDAGRSRRWCRDRTPVRPSFRILRCEAGEQFVEPVARGGQISLEPSHRN